MILERNLSSRVFFTLKILELEVNHFLPHKRGKRERWKVIVETKYRK